jgi:hypothetical protein
MMVSWLLSKNMLKSRKKTQLTKKKNAISRKIAIKPAKIRVNQAEAQLFFKKEPGPFLI